MAGSVNKVILIGNLGKDPEVRHLSNGNMVTTIPVATSDSYKDKTSGEYVEVTDWHNVVLWRKLAEIAEKFLKKGSKVYIEGKLKTRSWQDNEGNTKYTTEIIADEMTMLDRAKASDDTGSNPSPAPTPMEKPKSDLTDEGPDDLPF